MVVVGATEHLVRRRRRMTVCCRRRSCLHRSNTRNTYKKTYVYLEHFRSEQNLLSRNTEILLPVAKAVEKASFGD